MYHLLQNHDPNNAPLRVNQRGGFWGEIGTRSARYCICRDKGHIASTGFFELLRSQRADFKSPESVQPKLAMRSASMALASQAAVSALEARREVRAGRPAASRHWNSPAHRSVWSRGVPRVLVHRKKGTDKPRLRSRCALRRSPPLAPCARALNSLVARRARAGCSHRRLGCHRAREVLPGAALPLPSPPRSTPPYCSPPPSPPPTSPTPSLGPSPRARSPPAPRVAGAPWLVPGSHGRSGGARAAAEVDARRASRPPPGLAVGLAIGSGSGTIA